MGRVILLGRALKFLAIILAFVVPDSENVPLYCLLRTCLGQEFQTPNFRDKEIDI